MSRNVFPPPCLDDFLRLVDEVGEEEAHRRVMEISLQWGKSGMVQFYLTGVPADWMTPVEDLEE